MNVFKLKLFIIMKKVYAMQNKEIARRLEVSIGTVEKHLTKGIRQLNNTIMQRYGDIQNHHDKDTSRKGSNNG